MNVTRDYYYEVNERGVLTLDGVVQDDPWFLDFFFRRLALTANPHYDDHPFVSRCGDEMNYLRAADTPIVYTGFDGDRLFYAHSLSIPLHPEKLSYSKDGVLYHWSPVGDKGRIVAPVAMELSRWIEPWGPFFAFRDERRQRMVPLTPMDRSDDIVLLRPKADNACVGCGDANPFSLGLTFVHDKTNGWIRTFVKPDMRMQGSLGITHGGFVALLLDETMGKSLSVQSIKAPTAQLSVNFRKPLTLGTEYEVRSWIERRIGRKNLVKGMIVSTADGSVVADADALFLTLRDAAHS